METQNRFYKAVTTLLFIVLVGCASGTKNKKPVGSENESTVGSSLVVSESPIYQNSITPNKAETIKPIVLVLSPGSARAFAQAGIIKALIESKVRIAAVLGTEMGALVAATFAAYPQINAFDWQLQKFKETDFIQSSKFLGIGQDYPMDAVSLGEALAQVFQKKQFSELKTSLLVGTEDQNGKTVFIHRQGAIVPAIRSAVSIDGLIKPSPIGTEPHTSSSVQRPYLVQEAKDLNLGPVVLIDSMVFSNDRILKAGSDESDEELSQIEKKLGQAYAEARDRAATDREKADLVIYPDLRSIGLFEFKKRNEAIYLGKKAIQPYLDRIKELTGQAKP